MASKPEQYPKPKVTINQFSVARVSGRLFFRAFVVCTGTVLYDRISASFSHADTKMVAVSLAAIALGKTGNDVCAAVELSSGSDDRTNPPQNDSTPPIQGEPYQPPEDLLIGIRL